MSNDTIKQAREALKRWRDGSKARGHWSLGPADHDGFVDIDCKDGTIVSSWYDDNHHATDRGIATLIVGTAGNPDLLDAIDGLLEAASRLVEDSPNTPHRLVQHAKRIAAAIVAADELMSA